MYRWESLFGRSEARGPKGHLFRHSVTPSLTCQCWQKCCWDRNVKLLMMNLIWVDYICLEKLQLPWLALNIRIHERIEWGLFNRAFVCGAYVHGAFVHGAYDWRACVRGASVPAPNICNGEIESSTLTSPPWSRINCVPEFPDVIKHEKKVPTSLPSIIFVALPSRVSRLHCGYFKNKPVFYTRTFLAGISAPLISE